MTRIPTRALAPIAAAAVLAVTATAWADDDDERLSDLIIVHIAANATVEAFMAAFEANHPEIDLTQDDRVPGRKIYLLNLNLPEGYSEDLVDELEDDLEDNYGQYLHVGDDEDPSADFLYENQTAEGRTGSTYISGIAEHLTDEQYTLPLMGVHDAHDRSTGLGTVVAVLDTGVDATHPRLAGRVLHNGWNFVGDDADVRDVGDGADTDGDGDTDEMVGHGTFIAGLVALVAPDASILPVRVLDGDGNGNEWTLVRGLYFAIDRGVEVINLSLGSTHDTTAVKEAVAEAASRGIVVAAAAGNRNRDDADEYPAYSDSWLDDPPTDITGAFGVAATDDEDVKADFSNYGEELFISAPGDAILEPFDPARSIISTLPGNDYGAWKGTSPATAFVSAAAAVIRSQHPEWPADLSTYEAIERILAETAADLPEGADGEDLGAGRLDVAAAAAAGPPAPRVLGDLDNDGTVGFADLLQALSDWGRTHSSADLDGNGLVDFSDVILLLSNWG